ncbi:hypothetical protein [Thermus tengchongensis]|uniref:hypothetical protein n=1 Tax=Thermus tengchongensis TaxID=1214928 RepID=UPI000689345A|nr:hypothetical protein [Thermus tengchongensis]
MDVLEEKWQEVLKRLSALEPGVAQEVVRKARETAPSRRAGEVYRALTGKRHTPLEEPFLQAATVLVQEGLAQSYEEALGALGLEASSPGEVPGSPPPEGKGAEPEPPSPAEDLHEEAPPSEEEAPSEEEVRALRDEQKWRQAYRVVFGEEPAANPQLYATRLRRALLLYHPDRGRRAAFEEVREMEQRLTVSQTRASELLRLAEAVAPLEDAESLPRRDLDAALIQIGRLSAQVEELARKMARLEEAVQREATRYGGVKAALQTHHAELKALGRALEALEGRGGGDLKRVEGLVRSAKAEALAEMEERLRLATDLWRGEMEPRLRALEEWAKRITEAFRRTLEAKGRGKGLFGLWGGKE